MVTVEQQDVGVIGTREQAAAEHGTGLQVERQVGFRAQACMQAFAVPAGGVDLLEADRRVWMDQLHRFAVRRRVGGAQHRVAVDQRLQGAVQSRDIERGADGPRHRQAVFGAAWIHGPQEPHGALAA